MRRDVSEIIVAVAGNPNSGKTTIFNAITGSAQRVGNWPGVTVEKLEGRKRWRGKLLRFVDLPGTYSLTAFSPEERIARDFLLYEHPDVVLTVVDASNLERNLYLVAQVIEIGHPTVIALNMFDLARAAGMEIDVDKLAEILGAPVVPTVGTKGEGTQRLLDEIVRLAQERSHPKPLIFADDVEEALGRIEERLKLAGAEFAPRCHIRRYVVEKLLEGDEEITRDITESFPQKDELVALVDDVRAGLEKLFGTDIRSVMAQSRYAWASGLFREVAKAPGKPKKSISQRIDDIVLSKWLGFPIFFAVMFVLFYLTFTVGGFFADLLESAFTYLASAAADAVIALGGSKLFASLLSDGIIGGVGSVLVFLPNIAVLFFLVGLLEDSGYISRAAFLMDRVMHRFGLHGKSFIPMLLGFGCSVPAVMATRTLRDPRDRLTTMLVLPFVPCSARLPALVLFASVLFPQNPSVVVFGMYVLGIVAALLVAFVLKRLVLGGLSSPFVMELPQYHTPAMRVILRHTWIRSFAFIRKAGTVILVGAVFIWLLGNLPPGVPYASEDSYVGKLGKLVAPVFAPQGFGWKGVVALVFGFLAKEVVVSSLGVLYGGEENLPDVLSHEFPKPTAWAFLVFAMLYTPCVATLAAIRSEGGGTRWALISAAVSSAVAWGASMVAYALASAL